jgi:putative transposase
VIALCVREGFHQATGDHNIPLLLSGLRFLEGPTRDFGRHGEMTLCTALDVGLKRTITSIRRHQRHMELQSFVDQLSQNVPQEFNVHLLVDDESSYKNQTIRRWIVNQPRFHFHHTSSYTFWLTQFRTMVNLVAQQAIRPGTFKIVAEISSKVDRYVELCKKHRRAFAWTASQESIVAKLKRRDDFIYNHHTD